MKTSLPPPLPLRILTHNIRYATPSPFRGEQPWPTRLPLLLSSLRFHTHHIPPTIICLQEVLLSQLIDILAGLNPSTHSSNTPTNPSDTPAHSSGTSLPPLSSSSSSSSSSSPPSQPEQEWTYVGVGRDDGLLAGEFSPILYRPATYTLLSTRTIWLSETPTIPGSKSWDAALPRILTIGVFRHRESGREVVVMNTHLDDRGTRSRVEAAGMIVREVAALGGGEREGEKVPVLLAGDFNSEVDGGAYRVVTGEGSPLVDLREEVPLERRYGHENTYTGFGFEEEKRPTRIDFLFVGRGGGGGGGGTGEVAGGGKGGVDGEGKGRGEGKEKEKGDGLWKVDNYGVLESRFEDGVFVSDHRAVVGDVALL